MRLTGGRWLKDPKTGELTRLPPNDDEAPAAAEAPPAAPDTAAEAAPARKRTKE